jgi:hypothetical protein
MLAALTGFAALGFAGCPDDQVHFHDNIDLVFDFRPFNPAKPPPDDLHTPYVVGATFRMYAFRDHDRMRLDDAWVASSNPSVMDIAGLRTSESSVSFDCYPDRPGFTDITVYRNDRARTVWGRARVEVAVPDRAQLTFAGPLFINASDHETDEFVVRGPVPVVVNGTASFLVEYFRNGTKLSGNGVLDARPRGDGIDAHVRQTWLVEDREWIQLTPFEPGDHVVDLYVGDLLIETVTVRAVQPEDVAFIELRPESDKAAREGDFLAVWALGYDDAGNPIFGLEFDWDILNNLQSEPGEGDLFKYEYERREDATLEASYRGETQRVHIHADYGWVSSTNDLGCTAGRFGGAGPGALALAAVSALVLVLRRRRNPAI